MEKKIYFASDFHLGVDGKLKSSAREVQIIRWLHQIQDDAQAIYIVGDLFDFWFEYKHAIPKGFIRILGKIAELHDRGIPIILFTGNHDMWLFDYFEKEIGLTIHRNPIQIKLGEKKFFIGHGDGLGPGDHGYKFLKRVFANKVCQWLFARIHPNTGIGMAKFWSQTSRKANPDTHQFLGPDQEWLIQFAHKKLEEEYFDYFIFGHRHLPIDYKLHNGKSRYINLGEWLSHNSYAVFDGTDLQLKFFENEQGKINGNLP